MNKYDEIAKLQNLKESGSITQEEYELEKNRVLNDNSKKKSYKGLIIVIVIIIVITGLCLLADNMWYSSGNHGKSVAQQKSINNMNNTNK